ncbi:Aste57867_15468 [Aphanomyces stellatus]|uniref:Aste57867_15468 protein n=1 Tax=Aphanomyces stellatus TaxID=120398 RepID=A0A485L472_9STRA|nr:hypothetical protein As57867_015412 [Aphanomyces stellatus]VFT92270.1 Aste57867_15468 [Aphanomyces stellatus]
MQSVAPPAVGPPAKKARTRAPPKTAAPKATPQAPPVKVAVPTGAKPAAAAPDSTTPKGKRPTAATAKKKQAPVAAGTAVSMNGPAGSTTATPSTNTMPSAAPGSFGANGTPSMNSNASSAPGGGLQRSYSGINLTTGNPPTGANGNNGAPGDASAHQQHDPTMRRSAMQALYMRYKQLHGSKVDDTTLQRMAAKLEQQIAMKSANREEYTVNSQNEIKRIDLSQRMYGTPPQGSGGMSGSTPTDPSTAAAAMQTPNGATSASMGQFTPAAAQQQMLQRQMSQNMLYGNTDAASAAAMQAQMAAGNAFQHAAAPGNLSYQEFCQRMRFQPMDKLVDIMWNQRLMIFQLQQETVAYKKQCGAMQQMMMTMNMNMNNGYGNMAQYQQFQGQQVGMKAQSPMYNGGGYGMPQQPSMDPSLTRQASMNNMAYGSQQQQPQAATPLQQSQAYPSQPGAPPAAATTPSVPATTVPTAAATTTSGPPTTAPQTAVTTSANSGASVAAAYWKKVAELKEKHSDHLKKAYQILCMAAQSGSRQTSKAESMKQNIHYAIVVLNESAEGGAQPRDANVLMAIETFIVESIVPLVKKVQEVSQTQQHLQQQQQMAALKAEQMQQPPVGEFTKQLFDAMPHAPSHAQPQAQPAQVPPPPPSASPAAQAADVAAKAEEKKENASVMGNMDDFADFPELDDLDDDKLDDDDDDNDDGNGSSGSTNDDGGRTKRPLDGI